MKKTYQVLRGSLLRNYRNTKASPSRSNPQQRGDVQGGVGPLRCWEHFMASPGRPPTQPPATIQALFPKAFDNFVFSSWSSELALGVPRIIWTGRGLFAAWEAPAESGGGGGRGALQHYNFG